MTTKSLLHSSLLDNRYYTSMLAGNAAYVEPGDFDLLTTQVLSSDSSTVVFTGLDTAYAADYTHLQIRASLGRASNNDNQGGAYIRIPTTNPARYWHFMHSTGSSTISTSGSGSGLFYFAGDAAQNRYSAHVFDILDAFRTDKYPVIRHLSGQAGNNEPFIQIGSMVEDTTAAISSIDFQSSAVFAAGSRFSIYGLKA